MNYIDNNIIFGPSNKLPSTEEIKKQASNILTIMEEYETEMEQEGIPQIINDVKRRQQLACEARTRYLNKEN